MEIEPEKEQFRRAVMARGQSEEKGSGRLAEWGKAAERIRRLGVYRKARNVMVSPVPLLQQVRLNVLTDRKCLTLPTPGLQKGFVILDPKVIPPKKRAFAMRLQQGNPFAEKIPYQTGIKYPIDLIITEALAVGKDGSRLGDGQGFMDLQFAILRTLGWVDPSVRMIAVVEESRIYPSVPMVNTDVGVHWIVTPQGLCETTYGEPPECGVIWDRLVMKQIRRNDALYYLYRNLRAASQ